MDPFRPSDENEEFDIDEIVEELDEFFDENGAGLDGTIDLVYSDMDRVNHQLVEALDQPEQEQMEGLYTSMVEWGQHVAHLIYYVGIDGQADTPQGFPDFVMSVPALQMMLVHMQDSDNPEDNLQRLATGWMEIRSCSEQILEELAEQIS
jgi:hypothetical protein